MKETDEKMKKPKERNAKETKNENKQPTILGKQIDGQQSKAKEDKKLFNFLSLHHTSTSPPVSRSVLPYVDMTRASRAMRQYRP